MAFISLKDVEKTYKNGINALYGINLEIEKGEFVFIIGASGSGKSTIIKMLNRTEKPTKGEIFLGGINVSKVRNSQVYKLRRRIGIVFQDYKLLPKLTAYENIAFALEMYGLSKEEVRKKTLKALELVGLKARHKSYPNQLSGGEQQRIAIARAIVNSPKLLICDEPTGNLDGGFSTEIMKVLEKINSLGTTVIMATHDANIVNKTQKRVVALDNGKLISDVKEGGYTINESNKNTDKKL